MDCRHSLTCDSSRSRSVPSASLANIHLGCELAGSQPTFPEEGNEDVCPTGPSNSSVDPQLKLRDILGLVSGLLAGYENRAAILIVKNLASSDVVGVDLAAPPSAFKDQVAHFLDTHTTAVSKFASIAIERYINEDATVGSSSTSRRQPGSDANEMAISSPTLAQGENERAWSMDAAAEPKLKLRDVLDVISSLLDDLEARAAHLLVDNLASSKLGEAELACTQTAFKNQIAVFLDTHRTAVSKNASMLIRRRIRQDVSIGSPAATGAVSSTRVARVGRLSFRRFGPRPCLSLSMLHSSSQALRGGQDRQAALSSVDNAYVHFAFNRTSFRHEDVDASDSEHGGFTEISGPDEYDSTDGTRTPSSISSRIDCDEDSEWEYEAFPEITQSTHDKLDQVSYLCDGVEEAPIHTEDQVLKDGRATLEENSIAPRQAAFRHDRVEEQEPAS